MQPTARHTDSFALNRRTCIAALVAGGAGAWLPAGAQTTFPSKPFRLICPYGAGGPVDVVGRYMGSCLQRGFGDAVPAVMDNLAGGAGITGTVATLRAPPDGHTLLVQVTAALLTTQLLNRQPGFDAQKDFTPVWGLASQGTVILVNAQSPYKSVKDLVEAARAQPGRLTYGSSGSGTTPHINTEMFMRATGTRMTHVPYKSSAAAINDLMGGHIDCFLAAIASSIGLIQEGRIRGLAVLRADRVAEISQVPTLKDSGLTDWMPPPAIFAFYAGRDVPAPVRAQIAAAAQKGLDSDAQAAERLRKLGLTHAISGPSLLETVQVEANLLRKTISDANIAIER